MKTRIVKALQSFLKGWGASLAIAILIATSFKSAIADWNDIPTGSMEPTILIGDRVLVNKLAYDLKVPYTTAHIARWSDPERGDIVVFYSPENGKRLIKRVVGVPGDTIGMKQNRLFVNGAFLTYQQSTKEEMNLKDYNRQQPILFMEKLPNRRHAVQFLPQHPSLNSFEPVKIPENQYFMMGDNRDNSADSRFFGFVDRSLIVGQAISIALSRDKSFAHPRWNRFLKELL